MKKSKGGAKVSVVRYLAMFWTFFGLVYLFAFTQFFREDFLAIFGDRSDVELEMQEVKEEGNGKGIASSVSISERKAEGEGSGKGSKITSQDYRRYGSGTPVVPDDITYPKILPEPTENYPQYSNLLQLVTDWNPDDPDVPETFVETLQHFDYSDPKQRAMAAKFRNAELPFKVFNVPDINKVSELWSLDYLKKKMKSKLRVERSEDNHFMYFKVGRHQPNGWEPPQTVTSSSFDQWLEKAMRADKEQWNSDQEHFYLTIGTTNRKERTFWNKDLAIFSTETNNFFITKVEKNKGIQCRFGMRGVIAESHYDAGRNMVAMLKGAKRYVLNPPDACPYLGIISNTKHPSYRCSIKVYKNLDIFYYFQNNFFHHLHIQYHCQALGLRLEQLGCS